jgi:hypothetical protein
VSSEIITYRFRESKIQHLDMAGDDAIDLLKALGYGSSMLMS